MATLVVKTITDAGLDPDTPAYVSAVAAGDDFANNGRTFVEVVNGAGSPITVTFAIGVDPHATDPLHSTSDDTVSVTNGERRLIGPFPTLKYGNVVTVVYSSDTTITVAAFTI